MVHVHHTPAGYGHRELPGGEADPETVLRQAVGRARSLASTVPVEGRVLEDTSVPHAILKSGEGARMVVVGTKGHGLIRETIGSTAHAVLHHAAGPVLISRRAGRAGN
ncbi:universal stress protein, partial [Escherichia coli]|uniref:universal stress protein n=1 Tax=Escherichia coli TaxID=562 RepID=UPI003D9C4532